jgi:hypothetical protein
MKRFLKVWMARSAALRRWIPGGASWKSIFFVEESLEGIRAFIVETLEAGLKANSAQSRMEFLVSSKDGRASAILEGFGEDAVAVIVVEN